MFEQHHKWYEDQHQGSSFQSGMHSYHIVQETKEQDACYQAFLD